MKAITVVMLAALVAASALSGCATTTSQVAAVEAQTGLKLQPTQGTLGLMAQEDPYFTMGNPFRLMALVLYPVGLLLQRGAELPYWWAASVSPSLFGMSELELQYLEQRWTDKPGASPHTPAAQSPRY